MKNLEDLLFEKEESISKYIKSSHSLSSLQPSLHPPPIILCQSDLEDKYELLYMNKHRAHPETVKNSIELIYADFLLMDGKCDQLEKKNVLLLLKVKEYEIEMKNKNYCCNIL